MPAAVATKSPSQRLSPADEDGVPERGMNLLTWLVLATSTCGGLLFGLDIGTTAITSMNTFRGDMGIPPLVAGQQDSVATANQISMFPVLFHIFTLLGAPFAGFIADRVGRKPVILVASTLFALGALWQAMAGLVSPSFAWSSVLLGRSLGGVGNGFVLTIMPVYSAELAPASLRGKVITVLQLNITLGIFLMALINSALDTQEWGWRVAMAVQIVPCVFVIVSTLLALPESPRYLVNAGRSDEARAALALLARGTPNADEVVAAELGAIEEEVEAEKAVGQGGFAELLKGTALPAFMCGCMIAASQNITGVNWFMNYATSLFSSLGFEPFIFDLILKAINMLATFVAVFVVDRLGRKFLTLWGTIFTVIIFLLMGTVILATGVDIVSATGDSTTKAVQIFVVAMIFCFQVVFAITWGPMGWLVPGEVFPLRLRGVGMSAAVVANMVTNIALGDYGYHAMSVSDIGLGGTVLVLCGLNALIVLGSVVFLQPETKNVTMEEMRYVFAYEKGGSEEHGHGNMHAFYMRNAKQAGPILRLRTVDPRAGFDRFTETSAKQLARV